MTLQLDDLIDYPVQGIYRIINRAIPRVYIAHSDNTLIHLSVLISGLKTNRLYAALYKDIETYGTEMFEVRIIETYDTPVSQEHLRIRLYSLCTEYESEGYTLYNSYKGLQYKVTTRIGQYSWVYVEACYKPNRRVVIGVFKDIQEADRFVASINLAYPPIPSNNELTQKFKNKMNQV